MLQVLVPELQLTQFYLPMPDKFKHRSSQSELLDSDTVPAKLLFRNLRELDFLNRTSGGHSISLEGIKKLIKDKNKNYHIVDLGCGSGDSLKYFADWARKNNFSINFTGVDKNKNAISFLERNCSGYPEIEGFTGDYRVFLNQNLQIDIVHCSLFCHHLKDNELIKLLEKMNSIASTGFVINDLQRNRFAYYGAKIMTTLLNGSSLSKNDGPVSVLRGFKYNELELLIKRAGIKHFIIYRRRGFRFLVVVKKEIVNRKN